MVSWKNDGTIQMYGCKCSFEIKIRRKQICQIHLIYAIYGCNYSSKKQRIGWGMVGRNYFREILCSEKIFPEITYKEKMFLRNNYSTLDHSLFLWIFTYYFTKIFVHLSIIAAVCYFSVYKLIGWDAANIYLFKFNGRTLEKIVNYVQS